MRRKPATSKGRKLTQRNGAKMPRFRRKYAMKIFFKVGQAGKGETQAAKSLCKKEESALLKR